METIEKYVSTAKKASDIISKALPEQSEIYEKDADKLITDLKLNSTVKIPFVGDFNAGKSSLLNAMLDMTLLPTNITPETAVSYELIYSPQEKLEVVRNGLVMSEFPISSIASLEVKPGDIVRVYLNKTLLKDFHEKGFTLVDMPGIDSGLEAHNAAIASYLSSGTRYMVFSDAEQGTIRLTTLSFIKELLKYDDIDFSVFLSKTDKKPLDDVIAIQQTSTETVSKISPNHSVGKTSAYNKEYSDVLDALNRIDAEGILKRKFKGQVELLIDQMIQSLQYKVQLMKGDIQDADKAIEEINAKKKAALEQLRYKKNDAQPLVGSADDVVQDIRNAIVNNSASIAAMILNKAEADKINNAMLQIIRPVFVNSFKRELSEYNEVISSVVVDFVVDVEKIVSDSDNSILAGADDIIGSLVGKDMIENVLGKGLEKLAARFIGYKGIEGLIKGLSKILGPLSVILINIIPDILRLFFGKSKQEKLVDIQAKVCSSIAVKVSEGMRPEIEKTLMEQRELADRQIEELLEKEAAKIDESIRDSIRIKSKEKEVIQSRINELSSAAVELRNLKATI
ncbi:MAG: dynamin family protein [Duncaniella sp.]|nr:dynamin family protein [Duncaniella sp.]